MKVTNPGEIEELLVHDPLILLPKADLELLEKHFDESPYDEGRNLIK